MKTVRNMALAALILGSRFALPMAQAQQPDIKATDLQRHDLSAPGRQAVQVRLDLAPGVPFGNHTHPGEEVIYVLEAALEYQLERKPPATLTPADVLFI